MNSYYNNGEDLSDLVKRVEELELQVRLLVQSVNVGLRTSTTQTTTTKLSLREWLVNYILNDVDTAVSELFENDAGMLKELNDIAEKDISISVKKVMILQYIRENGKKYESNIREKYAVEN